MAPLVLLYRLGVLKAAYFMAILFGLCFWSNFDKQEFYGVNARWPRQGEPTFLSHFATWDAAHYLYLSEVGYRHGLPSCAFYPLWPLMVRCVSSVLGASCLLTALILGNVISLSAWMLFYQLVAKVRGVATAQWSLIFLIAFPGSLFFQFNYSESLFLLLVLLLWFGLEGRRYGWAWFAASLMPLTRPVGVFAIIPITWYAVNPLVPWFKALFGAMRSKRQVLGKLNDRDVLSEQPNRREWLWRELRKASPAAWLLLAPLLGWSVYLMLMTYWTGHPFEGFAAQKYWGVHSISNLWNVPKFIYEFFSPTEWHDFKGSVLDRFSFLLIINCSVLLWRIDRTLLVWLYILTILPAMSGSFTSFTRFASCSFPVFIALGVFFSERRSRWPPYALLSIFVSFHALLVWRYVNFRWAG